MLERVDSCHIGQVKSYVDNLSLLLKVNPFESKNINNSYFPHIVPLFHFSRASSVPTSPVAINKLHRSSTNPFFTSNIQPSKDPPKYDEAIKNRPVIIIIIILLQ